jgi:transposase
MVAATDPFSTWLTQAHIREHRLTPDQRGALRAAFNFRLSRGNDSYSTRLLTHFLLHCGSGLKVAQLARLAGVSRPTASRQQGMSSKQAVQQAHHRSDGRPYGKLLPRYAGPIIEFLLAHPKATRAQLLDFIDHSFGVRVSRIALYKFLKKFGIDRVATTSASPASAVPTAPAVPTAAADPADADPVPPRHAGTLATVTSAPAPAPPFSSGTRSMRAPS